jgi:hypothetical protein
MSLRAFRWLVWVLLVALLPLPYFMVEIGRVPVAQLLMFAAVTSPLLYTDPGFTSGFIAGLFLAQSLLYGLLLWWAAGLMTSRLPPTRRIVAAAAIAGVLITVASLPLYRAPLTHGPTPTNWLGLW